MKMLNKKFVRTLSCAAVAAVSYTHLDVYKRQVQNQVLAGHPGGKLAGEHELDGRGHLEPCHAGGHACGHIGRAYTGGEGTQRTVGTCLLYTSRCV